MPSFVQVIKPTGMAPARCQDVRHLRSLLLEIQHRFPLESRLPVKVVLEEHRHRHIVEVHIDPIMPGALLVIA